MAAIELSPTHPDKIVIESAWSEKDQIKEVPGTRWDADGKVWTAPLTWAACVQLRGVFGQSLAIGPELREWARLERQDRIDECMNLRSVVDLSAEGFLEGSLWTKLYGFQRAGVNFLKTAGSALLADEMGTGKTIQTLTTLRYLCQSGTSPALVVCPNSMKRTWAREARTWYPEATPYVIEGTAVQRRKIFAAAQQDASALVIINFEGVRGHSRTAGFGSLALAKCAKCDKHGTAKETACEVHPKELNAIPFHVVVVDEAHRIKDPNAKQTRSIWAVGDGSTVKHRYALTGTPIANDASDLWSVMRFVSPEEFPTKSRFVERYCDVTFTPLGYMEIGGIKQSNKEELFRILHPRMRRMPKALVLPFLPQKVYSKRYVTLTKEQRKAYDQMATGLVSRLDDGTLMVAKENIVANTRLLQFSSAYMEKTGEKENPQTGEMEDVFTMRDPSPKLDAMEEILNEMGGKKLVIAGVSRQLIKLAEARLTKLGVKFGVIAGDIKQWERDAYIQEFQKPDSDMQVMLLTMQAGGVGITLTAADTILFLQRSWSMVENKQTVDRVHRIGSEVFQQINVIDLVAEDTVEEKQIEDVWLKEQRMEEIVEDQKVLANA